MEGWSSPLFARSGHGRGATCWSFPENPGATQEISIGRTSTFFASLVAQVLLDGADPGRLGLQCGEARARAFEHTRKASVAWSEGGAHFYGNPAEALRSVAGAAAKPAASPAQEPNGQLAGASYDRLWTDWSCSSRDDGVVPVEGADEKAGQLQLWRGFGTLKSDVCIGGRQRDAISRLVAVVDTFKQVKDPQHPLSCLLLSPPGWGKSVLARCLAEHFGVEYLELSIAQLAGSEDVLDSLSTLASVQSRKQGKVLVFVDEMNAAVEGHNVFGLCLGPLWHGVFLRGGRAFHLRPAVWVFAATSSTEDIRKGDDGKGSDFLSRLNGPILDFGALSNPRAVEVVNNARVELLSKAELTLEWYEAVCTSSGYIGLLSEDGAAESLRTEQVYLLVNLLRRHWGPLDSIQTSVLRLFHDLLPINGFRSLEIFSERFAGIRRGRILASNVPRIPAHPELLRHLLVPGNWLARGDGPPADCTDDADLVRIVE